MIEPPWICVQLMQILDGTNIILYAHLEEILGIGLVMELVHPKAADSCLKVEKNPPSLLLCAVVPLHQCDIVCDLCLLLYPFIHFPTLCERLDVQCFSRKDGLLSSYIMLSEAQPLPGSLLSAQKRPVVWRYRPVTLCSVARR